jgi:hypothetical protein
VVVVGGVQTIEGALVVHATAFSLDLATLAWGGGGAVPDLPAPRESFSLGQLPGGRLVVAGGGTADGDTATAAAFEWAPGRAAWTPGRSVGLDAVVWIRGLAIANRSVEVLAADGSGWATLPPMATARYDAVAGRLPGGQIIVAGGINDDERALASAELWDPATGAWAALPPMAHGRATCPTRTRGRAATGCVLPSGRFAVLGGGGGTVGTRDAEAFDPMSRAWQPLAPMPRHMAGGAAVGVAGGLLAVGGIGHADAMLFGEESGRWFTLPGQMPMGGAGQGLTTVPAPRGGM